KKSLEAIGADRVFLQPCKVPNWKRGGNDFVAITGVNGEARMQPLAALALGNSMGSNGLIEAEVVAVSSFEELEKRKDEVDGENNVFHGAFAQLTRLSRRKGGAAQGAWEAHRALRALFAMGEAGPADAVAAGLGMPPAGVFGPR
ncbi:MAG: hypothetical protein RI979_1746, partial [Pseudomonadota bacterium]